jgi:hypothetical protein
MACWHLALWPPPWRRDHAFGKLVGWVYFIALIPVVTIVSVVVLISVPFQRWAARRAGPRMTRADVAKAIESHLEGASGPWDWDDFVSVRIGDARLDTIRKRCAQLDREFPPERPRQYCALGGVEVLRGFVRELRASDG